MANKRKVEALRYCLPLSVCFFLFLFVCLHKIDMHFHLHVNTYFLLLYTVLAAIWKYSLVGVFLSLHLPLLSSHE